MSMIAPTLARAALLALTVVLAACGGKPSAPGTESTATTGAAKTASAKTDAAQTASSSAFEVDTDGDGRISRQEHSVAAWRMFRDMDRDGDLRVTVAEMDAQRGIVTGQPQPDTLERLREVDGNHNGVLERDEHRVSTGVVFDEFDRDLDGYLERAELERPATEGANPSAPSAPAG